MCICLLLTVYLCTRQLEMTQTLDRYYNTFKNLMDDVDDFTYVYMSYDGVHALGVFGH